MLTPIKGYRIFSLTFLWYLISLLPWSFLSGVYKYLSCIWFTIWTCAYSFLYCTILVLHHIQQSYIVRFTYLTQNNCICDYIYIYWSVGMIKFTPFPCMINSAMVSMFYQFFLMLIYLRMYSPHFLYVDLITL